MKLIRHLADLHHQKQHCVATIGNFDGVHLGHQAVLEQVQKSAKEQGFISTVLLFEPQPVEFFSPQAAPSRLMRLREKLQQFAAHQIDMVVCLRFNEAIASLSATEFIETILLEGLAIKKLIVGDDFQFAKNREGDYQYLERAGQQYGFEVTMTQSLNLDDRRISSTSIRQCLATGDLAQATLMLGRPYQISGRVIRGEARGRRLGFATANIELKRYVSPVEGIFSGRVYGVCHNALDAVIYVGTKPVYNGQQILLEIHLLDFDGDLYGRYLQVEFFEKLRGDKNFESEAALIKQIKKDIDDTRDSLTKLKSDK